MNTKKCSRCDNVKNVVFFHRNSHMRDGYFNQCIECRPKNNKSYKKRYYFQNHWILTFYAIRKRCENKNHASYKRYGLKGIKNLLTIDDLKELWFRDKAYLMNRPSIDRLDSKKDYEISNCRYIELSENSSLANKGRKRGLSDYANT